MALSTPVVTDVVGHGDTNSPSGTIDAGSAGTDRLLILVVSHSDDDNEAFGDITNVVLDGQTMSPAGPGTVTYSDGGDNVGAAFFILQNDTINGTVNWSLDLDASSGTNENGIVALISITGVDISDPIGASGSGTQEDEQGISDSLTLEEEGSVLLVLLATEEGNAVAFDTLGGVLDGQLVEGFEEEENDIVANSLMVAYGEDLSAGANAYSWTTDEDYDNGVYIAIEIKAGGGAQELDIAAEAGSFTESGQDAALEYGYAADGAAGSFAWSGAAVSLEVGFHIDAGAGSFGYSGQDASLEYGYTVAAAAGSFTYSGQAAALEIGLETGAAAGAYTISGVEAGLEIGHLLDGAAGSFTYAGQTAALELGLLLSAGAGSFGYSGQAVVLTDSGSNPTVAAAAGSFTINGQDIGFSSDRLTEAEAGSYEMTGADADPGVDADAPAADTTVTELGGGKLKKPKDTDYSEDPRRAKVREAVRKAFVEAGIDEAEEAPIMARTEAPKLSRRKRKAMAKRLSAALMAEPDFEGMELNARAMEIEIDRLAAQIETGRMRAMAFRTAIELLLLET